MSALERALVDLGAHLRYPAADVAPAVRARLEAVPRSAPRPVRRMALLVAATLTLLVGGMVAFVPGVRAAFIRSFFVPGIRIVVGQPEPPAPVQRLGRGLDLGERVTLAEARSTADFAIRVPAGLGPPDEVFLDGDRVWLVYRAGPGLPRAHATGVGLLVTEFRGEIEEELLKKIEAQGGSFQPVEVDGNSGYWIRGAHTLFFLDPDGTVIAERTRVAGNVLVWEEGGVTYRLESDLSLVDTLRLAGSL